MRIKRDIYTETVFLWQFGKSAMFTGHVLSLLKRITSTIMQGKPTDNGTSSVLL